MPRGDLGFGQFVTDHMLEIYWTAEKGWSHPKIVPFHNFELHPTNTTLHYALEGFEGMKAYRDTHGGIRTFRPHMNAERLVRTSQELCFPTFEPDEFVKCLDSLLTLDNKWVPKAPSSTLLYAICSPSAAYFTGADAKPLKLFVETRGVRAWPGGSGHAKVGANYAVGIKYFKEALDNGYDQVLWLNGRNITEVGGCNFFVLWINKKGERELATPRLDGTILPGITRDSILELNKFDKNYVTAERPIPVSELVKAARDKRVLFLGMQPTR